MNYTVEEKNRKNKALTDTLFSYGPFRLGATHGQIF